MTTDNHSPDYITALLSPTTKSQGSRKAWSVDVEQVWVPFLTATNVMGETNLPDDVLGAPIRLSKNPDGEVKFSKTGRPMMRVHPVLNAQIGMIRENFVAGLLAYTGNVQEERTEDYAAQVTSASEAALPFKEQDDKDLLEATAKLEAALEAEEAKAAAPRSRSSARASSTPPEGQSADKTPVAANAD